MFCSKCGQEILDEAVVCIHCGCSTTNALAQTKKDDAPNGGYGVLGFFFPLIGLILYLVWGNDYPLRAKSAGKGALIGVIVLAVIMVLYFILFAVIMGIVASNAY